MVIQVASSFFFVSITSIWDILAHPSGSNQAVDVVNIKIFDYFGCFSPFLRYQRGQLKKIWAYNTEILFIKSNSTIPVIDLIIFFIFGCYHVGDVKKWKFLIIFGHFWPLLGYLSAHTNLIWPINTEILLVISIPTTPATFSIFLFSILGRLPCKKSEKCDFWPFWTHFDHFLGTWGVDWIKYDNVRWKHCLQDLIQQPRLYI